jgi:hypothetical protein
VGRVQALKDGIEVIGDVRGGHGLMLALELVADRATKARPTRRCRGGAEWCGFRLQAGAMVRVSGPNIILSPPLGPCMADHDYFGHSRPGAPGLGARIKATGYALRAGAENLAYTTELDFAGVGRMWQQSAPHWAAIIDPGHQDIGLAVVTGGGRNYWVMVVAR